MQRLHRIVNTIGLSLYLALFIMPLSGLGQPIEADNPEDDLSHISNQLRAGPNHQTETLEYFFMELKKLSILPHDTLLLAQVYNLIGGHFYMHARYDQALESAHKALRLYQNANDTTGLYKLYHNMGIIYEANKDYDQAWKFLMRANDMVDHLLETYPNDSTPLSIRPSLYNNMGIVCDNRGLGELAMQYYEKALECSHMMNNETVRLTAGLNIGILHSKADNYELALEFMESAHDLAIENEEHYHMANIYNNLGDIWMKMGHLSKANSFFNKALIQAREVNANEYIKNAYMGLFQTYQAYGDLENAIQYQALFYGMRDSISNSEIRQYIAGLEYKFEMERKEDELTILLIEKEIYGKRLKVKRLTQRYLSFGILLLIGLSGMLIYQNKAKQQAYNDLVKKNLEVVSHEFREENVTGQSNSQGIIGVYDEMPSQKYIQSPLKPEQQEKLLKTIEQFIQTHKPYLNKEFNLNQFAQSIGYARSYVSQVINAHYGKNFNTWVNEYRIREARRMMVNQDNQRLTIEAIAYEVGFASKSTFNEAFKKFTGITPSVFLKRIRGAK